MLAACGGSSKPPGSESGGSSSGGAGGSAGIASGGTSTTAGQPSGGLGQGATGGSDCESCAGQPAVEQVCEPQAQSCEGNQVMMCQSDGSGTRLWIDCGGSYHCVEQKGLARCEPNDCTPGSMLCDGNVLKTCTDEGTLPKKGKDCGDEVCDAGECKPQLCEPNSYFCKENVAYLCSPTGAAESVSFACDDRRTCQVKDDAADCVPHLCEPSQPACVDEAFGVCAADGLSLASTDTDCSAGGDICDLASGCGTTAVDALGKRKQVEMFSGGELATNVFDVRSARKLVQIETNWLLEESRDVRFVVYELEDDDLFHVRYDEIVSHAPGSGFFSSGTMDLDLEAGKRYLIGAGLVVGDGYVYYDSKGWSGVTSFATTLGSARTIHADEVGFAISPASLYVLRLKTTAP